MDQSESLTMNALINEDTENLQFLNVYNVLENKDCDKGKSNKFLLYFIIKYFNIVYHVYMCICTYL